MIVKSKTFSNGGSLPKKYTCQGRGISPHFFLEDIPEGTKSLALIVEDPDAPVQTYIHWVVYNILPVSEIAEDFVPGIEGVNTSRQLKYVPPCPPSGVHRYFFKFYALDILLSDKKILSKETFIKEMAGHLLAEAEIFATYEKR